MQLYAAGQWGGEGARTPHLGRIHRLCNHATLLCASQEPPFPVRRIEKPRSGRRRNWDAGAGNSISLPSATARESKASSHEAPLEQSSDPRFSPSSPGEEQVAHWPPRRARPLQTRPLCCQHCTGHPAIPGTAPRRDVPSNTRGTTRSPLEPSNPRDPSS